MVPTTWPAGRAPRRPAPPEHSRSPPRTPPWSLRSVPAIEHVDLRHGVAAKRRGLGDEPGIAVAVRIPGVHRRAHARRRVVNSGTCARTAQLSWTVLPVLMPPWNCTPAPSLALTLNSIPL